MDRKKLQALVEKWRRLSKHWNKATSEARSDERVFHARGDIFRYCADELAAALREARDAD